MNSFKKKTNNFLRKENIFSFVPLSKPKLFARVALVSLMPHSCRNFIIRFARIRLVLLVSGTSVVK